jgi:hypothetical protein
MNIPPGRPYKDITKKHAPIWFNTADAPDINAYNKLVNPEAIDQLRRNNGWAIVSTHLGKGFFKDNAINAEFKTTMKYLSSQNGWFVPASQILDLLKPEEEILDISRAKRIHMEWASFVDRLMSKMVI